MKLSDWMMAQSIPEVYAFIRKEGGKMCVHSHQTGKNFGCYESIGQAKKRLAQMKRFKNVKAFGDATALDPL
jgi:hypothetical protein